MRETGGKNATIVTAMANRDQAIKHVVHSAFGHGGQKCSATSLLLLEDEVYDNVRFRRWLCDAAESILVGSAWDLPTRMGPLIRPPSGDLRRALTTLEPGEEWALAPRNLEGNPNLWSPGIKYGVRPRSYTHMTEFFGPVLGVMRFRTLDEAIALVNRTGYGLTSGLESLDRREWDRWRSGVRAGNLYINRVTTGAVVLRQPFGGFGKSVFGPGMKAGGPNYVAQFMELADSPRGDEGLGIRDWGLEEGAGPSDGTPNPNPSSPIPWLRPKPAMSGPIARSLASCATTSISLGRTTSAAICRCRRSASASIPTTRRLRCSPEWPRPASLGVGSR